MRRPTGAHERRDYQDQGVRALLGKIDAGTKGNPRMARRAHA